VISRDGEPEKDKKGPPIGLIVGIIIGVLVLILLIVLIIYFVRKKREQIAADYQHEESLSEKEDREKQGEKDELELSDLSPEDKIMTQMVVPTGEMLVAPFIRDYEPMAMMVLDELGPPGLQDLETA
jgi:flagellar basal body-associated protein FliL